MGFSLLKCLGGMEYDSVRFNPGLGSDDLSSVPVKSGDPDGKRSVSASLFCPLSCTDRRDMKSDRCAGVGWGLGGGVCAWPKAEIQSYSERLGAILKSVEIGRYWGNNECFYLIFKIAATPDGWVGRL